MPKTKLLAAFVDKATHKAVRAAAVRKRYTISEFVRFAVEEYLAWQAKIEKEEKMARSMAQTAAIRIYKMADGVIKVAGPAITQAVKKGIITIADTFYNKGTTLSEIARYLQKKGVKL